ncbi:MAG: hypothetical protein IPP66_04900 [Anaerolineales bacterium]|nr:hypothetical protein [Anaerolineales bacterium]
MNLKMLNRLFGDDEEFWAKVKNQNKHVEYLNELFKRQAIQSLLLILYFILAMVGAFMRDTFLMAMDLFFLFGFGMLYIDTTSKIRMIRLYELLSTIDEKPM